MKKNKIEYITKEVFPSKELQDWVTVVKLQVKILDEDLVVLPDEGYWFISYYQETPIAFAGLIDKKIETRKKIKPKVGYLVRAGVLEEYRGNGIQYSLVQKRIEKAREMNYDYVVTTTYDNPHSANNLIKSGFLMYQPEDTWGCEGTNYWKKEL